MTEEEAKAQLREAMEALKLEHGWTAQDVSDYVEANN